MPDEPIVDLAEIAGREAIPVGRTGGAFSPEIHDDDFVELTVRERNALVAALRSIHPATELRRKVGDGWFNVEAFLRLFGIVDSAVEPR